jgi:pimeloyl-ACP methyl ester carboxylesterase
LGGEAYCRRDFSGELERLRGNLKTTDETYLETVKGHEVYEVRLEDDRGLSVIGHLKVTTDSETRHPALLILGGVRTGRRTIDYLGDTHGVILFALDYPYEGKRSGLSTWEFLSSLPRMRRAVINTVPAAQLAVDYLLARQDVDPDRIILASGSVGAILSPAVAANDSRIDALVVLFGGGDISSLIRANLDRPAWMAAPAAWLGKVITAPVEPLRYIGDVSPRPTFFLNGTEDLGFPVASVRKLHEAAEDPKTIRWIEAGHVVIHRPEFHHRVTSELAAWLTERDLVPPDAWVRVQFDDSEAESDR